MDEGARDANQQRYQKRVESLLTEILDALKAIERNTAPTVTKLVSGESGNPLRGALKTLVKAAG